MKLIAILIVALNIIVQAQDKQDSKLTDGSTGFFGVPFLMYSPETELGFGGIGMYYFSLASELENNTKLSSFLASLMYTTKNQMNAELNYDVYLTNNNNRFFGRISYARFPFSFFGTGNKTSELNEENYIPEYLTFETSLLKKLSDSKRGRLNTGIGFDIRTDKILEKDINGLLHAIEITGRNGGVASGISFIFNWDSRDNNFSSTDGEYLDLKATFYNKFLFSDFDFNSYLFDARKFFSINVLDTIHVFAMNLVSRFTTGNTPFYMLSTFGGDKLMRGIFDGRFRDKHMITLQSEYRFPIIWRFGLVFFGGFGQVAHKLSELEFSELKTSYGIGVRFTVIPEEKITGRLDFGFSDYGSQFYLSFSEAF